MNKGQSITEFALVLPLFILVALGAVEFSRILISFAEITNASREAARYGAATGPVASGSVRFLDCDGIRDAALSRVTLAGIEAGDILISYDRDDGAGGMAIYADCGDVGLDAESVVQGDRVVVTITTAVNPILSILPIPSVPVAAVTARTIMKDLAIGPVECQDGADNDGDGDTDYPDDDGCDNADDTIEAVCYRLEILTVPSNAGVVSFVPALNCANRLIEGTVVTLEALPEPLYTLDYWSGDASGTDPSLSVTMDSNKSVTANFRRWKADLNIAKSDNPDPVLVDNILRYVVGVGNIGPDVATGVVMTDTLPSGVTLLSATPTQGTCFQNSGIMRCELGDVLVETPVFINIQVDIPADTVIESIANAVVVAGSGREEDDDLSNNTDSESTSIVPVADLYITKSAEPGPSVFATKPLTYSIMVRNDGPSTANGVIASDVLPAGVTFLSANWTGGPCDYTLDESGVTGGAVSCSIGTLTNSATADIVILLEAPLAAGDISNVASVSGSEYDDDPANNDSIPVVTSVLAWSDLAISKSDSLDPTWRDRPLSYNISLFNSGPSDATGVQILDLLPENVNFVSAVGPLGSCSESNSTVTCDVGTVASGATTNVVIDIEPLQEGTIENNTWWVSAEVTDLDPSNDQATETTDVFVSADLYLDKDDLQDPVAVGETLIYEITVRNDGPSRATDVTVSDTMPSSVVFGSAGWPGGTCNPPSGRTFTCDLGTMLEDETVIIQLVVTPNSVGNIENHANVSANEPDPNSTNSQDHSHTDITGNVNLANILLSPGCGLPGTTISVNGSFFDIGPDTLIIDIFYEDTGALEEDQLSVQLLSMSNYTTNGGAWSENVVLPASPPAPIGNHQIRVTHGGFVLYENLQVPCN